MSFRIEDKYILDTGRNIQIKKFLLENNFEKKYNERNVTSIYMDNKNFSMYNESEEGTTPRKKIRFRFYDGNFKNLNFEIKINSQEGKYKISNKTNTTFLQNCEKIGYYDPVYGNCYPILSVNYIREYYQNKNYRITLDKNIIFTHHQNKFKQAKENLFVLEVKILRKFDVPNFLEQLPLDKVRYSKYSEGIKKIFN